MRVSRWKRICRKPLPSSGHPRKKNDGLINAILKISRDGRRELKPEPVNLRTAEATANSINHQVTDAGGE